MQIYLKNNTIKLLALLWKYFDLSIFISGKKFKKYVSGNFLIGEMAATTVYAMSVWITAVYLATFFKIN